MRKKKAPPKKRGPKPETFKIEGDWKEAVKRALKRGKPPAKVAKKTTRATSGGTTAPARQ
jgi:hypothetical protein